MGISSAYLLVSTDLRLEHGLGHEILGCDQLETGVLPVPLVLEDAGNVRIGIRQRSPAGWCLSVWHVIPRSPNLIQPPLMTSTLEDRTQPERHDLVGQARRDDAAADREDVGVVVFARHSRGIEIVA